MTNTRGIHSGGSTEVCITAVTLQSTRGKCRILVEPTAAVGSTSKWHRSPGFHGKCHRFERSDSAEDGIFLHTPRRTVLAYRTELGLLAEQADPGTGRQAGNTPQALSHLALVRAADALAQARGVATPGAQRSVARSSRLRMA